jgi:DNA-directed RNA polymerase specialized sigma24 family protein
VALEALPPRLKRVLELYYGEELTLREIGKILGVTEARMSQLVAEAVRRMRDSYPGTEIPANDKPPRSSRVARGHVEPLAKAG